MEKLKRVDATSFKVRETIRWKGEGENKHYYDCLQPTQIRNMKTSFTKEYQIIITDLPEYLNLERQFNKYELGCLTKHPGLYHPTIIWEYFSNYLGILEKDFPKGFKVLEM